MMYRFDLSEFEEVVSVPHRGLQIEMRLHPIFLQPKLLTSYASRDPFLAWIFVRRDGRVIMSLNAQYDSMLGALPFFLNRHMGFMGESIPGSERARMWSQSELAQDVMRFLDDAMAS